MKRTDSSKDEEYNTTQTCNIQYLVWVKLHSYKSITTINSLKHINQIRSSSIRTYLTSISPNASNEQLSSISNNVVLV